ncbi:hypothetical protein ACFXP3_34310, partial [Streptomyces sp. NPDC059096]|uniref:hypothetical protein n=1 Tax=Streptomyces sp. NPDC059096 TaxID=3346727 RepID=UPI0036B7DD07
MEQAADLLAATHTTGALDLADVGVARRLVARWHGSGPAVAAVRDGALTGFSAARGGAGPPGGGARAARPR